MRMSKKLYVGALGSSTALFLLSLILLIGLVVFTPGSSWLYRTIGGENWQNANILILTLAIGSGVLFLLVHLAITVILLYKMWSAIQDGHARTTPAQAVGYLFIPFYNFYWIFQVWGGFPADYNNYNERYQLNLPPLSSGIYHAYPTLIILSLIPLAGILSAVTGVFVFLLVTARTCDAINNLAVTVAERRNVFLRQVPIQNQTVTSV